MKPNTSTGCGTDICQHVSDTESNQLTGLLHHNKYLNENIEADMTSKELWTDPLAFKTFYFNIEQHNIIEKGENWLFEHYK